MLITAQINYFFPVDIEDFAMRHLIELLLLLQSFLMFLLAILNYDRKFESLKVFGHQQKKV